MTTTYFSHNVIRRMLTIMAAVVIIGMFAFTIYGPAFFNEPGDYETRVGDQHLRDEEWAKALAAFEAALKERPNHRGALMGKAIVYLQTKNYPKAVDQLTYLIKYLSKKKKPDSTDHGLMAAAFANRGIAHDYMGKYRLALADYIKALKIDEDTIDGPGLVDKIIYGTPRPSTVRKRAEYLLKQLKLPPEKRVMRIPKLDKQQRMHKP